MYRIWVSISISIGFRCSSSTLQLRHLGVVSSDPSHTYATVPSAFAASRVARMTESQADALRKLFNV